MGRTRTKAVANGALAWYLDNNVAARINKYHYGCKIRLRYTPNNPNFAGREVHTSIYTGEKVVHGGWSTIISQVASYAFFPLHKIRLQCTRVGYQSF
jgi:hypothetical protein